MGAQVLVLVEALFLFRESLAMSEEVLAEQTQLLGCYGGFSLAPLCCNRMLYLATQYRAQLLDARDDTGTKWNHDIAIVMRDYPFEGRNGTINGTF